jgi:hypothetical protein
MASFPFDTQKLIEICQRHQVTKISLFGSMVRGETTNRSDIDLVIEFAEKKSLLTLARLEREVSDALGREVDVLTENAISPYLRERIKSEMQVIYEAR